MHDSPLRFSIHSLGCSSSSRFGTVVVAVVKLSIPLLPWLICPPPLPSCRIGSSRISRSYTVVVVVVVVIV